MIVSGNRRALTCFGRGFSLFELALVLAIITTLAALTLPRYGASLARYRADLAARRIAVDLTLAQTNARTSSTSQSVLFSVGSNTYQILGMTDLNNPSVAYIIKLSDPPYNATLVSADFGGDSTICFDGWGVPDSLGSVVIKVGKEQRTITLDSETGKATVQ